MHTPLKITLQNLLSMVLLVSSPLLITQAHATDGAWLCNVPSGYTWDRATNDYNRCQPRGWAYTYHVRIPADSLWVCSVPSGYTWDRATNDYNRCQPNGWAYTYHLRVPAPGLWVCSVPSGYTWDQVTNDYNRCQPSGWAYTYHIPGSPPPPPPAQPPFGYFDVAQATAAGNGIWVAGWAIDPDAGTNAISVDISINGRSVGRFSAADSRPDVGAAYPAYGSNHGFGPVIPVDGGSHTVCVTAINVGTATSNVLLPPGCKTVTVTPPTGPTGQIVSVYANKCVDVAGAQTANGTAVQIFDCNGTAAQRWTIASDNTVRALGKCMDVVGGGTANHTLVQLYDCNGTGAQAWLPQADGSLLNPQSGRCLDDLGFATANGSRLGIWDCNGLSNQKWTIPH